jgi:hypothetical protein
MKSNSLSNADGEEVSNMQIEKVSTVVPLLSTFKPR